MKRFPAAGVPEFALFERLDSPWKVQDFLDAMPINFEEGGETARSPLMTLRANKAHCMEGAMLAAAMFWYHGEQPLVMNLKTTANDFGHVLALFRRNGLWGAVTKTNHAVLRFRDPVFLNPRELAMSYFNEYFLDDGRKTMRAYSNPVDLSDLDPEWLTSRKHVWKAVYAVERSEHNEIAGAKSARSLRRADDIEIEAGKLVEWKRGGRARPS